MADNQEVYVSSIRTNTDKLSSLAIRDVFVDLVRTEAVGGEVSLKALVPKGHTEGAGDLFAHVGHTGPDISGIDITASVGIPEIHKFGESDPLSAKYPIFVDKGTGIFGGGGYIHAHTKESMYIPETRGSPGFLKESKGQRGRNFMADTYGLMVAMLQVNGEKFKAELTARLLGEQLT